MHRLHLLPLILVLPLAGCGGEETLEKSKVTGTVTFEGKPLESGDIAFAPALGRGPSAGGTITNGTYDVDVPAGEMTVRITASRETGETQQDAMGQEIKAKEQYLPACYNDETTLKATVDQAVNTFNFDLKAECP